MKLLEATALANASRELLSKGDAVGAERVLAPVLSQLGSDAPSLHLMGLIKRSLNQDGEAERYFRSAIAHSFSEAGYYNDLGVVLQGRDEFGEAARVYRAALALTPSAAATRVNLVRCLMAANQYEEAEAEARTYIALQPGPEAWTLLGQVQRTQDRNDDALASAASALQYAPRMRGLKLNYAVALDRVGRAKEALEHYAALGGDGIDSAELALNYARSLYAHDHKPEAEGVLEEGLAQWPGAVALHTALARVRALRGEGVKATRFMEAEIKRRPKDMALRLACADSLHRGHHPEAALRIVDEALSVAPDTATLLNARGILLDELDRPQEALEVLRRVAEMSPTSRSAKRNLLSTMIRAGAADQALQIVCSLRAEEPDEQYLIACEALALRVLGDPAYSTLYDYDRLVRSYEITAPRGFFTVANFNSALADALRHQHSVNAHPLDQHLHHGSQTGRDLLTVKEANITALRAAVEPAVRDYIARLNKDAGDPVSARRRDRYRFSGMWSARLGNGGFQPNHVHDRGWISSAYFVAVSPRERVSGPRAGWLKFGEPNRPVAQCGPEKFVEPQPGMLVLFPSYMWHGTMPFEGSERLSAAFDVIPA